jgi:hypothetical protein
MGVRMNNKGQVTIFILLGILIVSSVLVFFLWVKPTYISDNVGIKGFEGCIEDALIEGISELEGKAGLVDSEFNYAYNGEDFTYLCYADNYYETCTVQVPLLKHAFDENLEALVEEKVDACYEASLNSLRDQGYEVESGEVSYEIEIEPGVARVKIDAPTSIGSQKFTRFNVRASTPIYDMLIIATSIVQFESKYGDSDASSMMRYYPEYYIEKVKRGEGTTVYILEHKIFGDKFKFASRSLVFPAGYAL